MRKNLTKIFAVMAMTMMSIGMWATPTPVSIPQDLGSYIDWNNADVTSANVENAGANVGSTGKNTVVTFSLTNETAQDYYLTMQTGHSQGTALLLVSVLNGETELSSQKIFVPHTSGSWTPSSLHNLYLGELPATTITLQISVLKTVNSNFAGNWGRLAVYGANQYTQRPSDTNVDLEHDGTHGTTVSGGKVPKYESGNTNICNIKNGGYSIYECYNSEDSYWDVVMGVRKINDGSVRMRIYDVRDIENPEVDQTFEVPATSPQYADQTFALTKGVTKGFKKVRFDYISSGDGWILNFNHLRFTKRGDYSGYIKSVAVGDDVMPWVGSVALRDNSGLYTYSENQYTLLPTVSATLDNGAAATVTSVVEGSNAIYTISGAGVSSTLTVENVHLYTAGAHDEDVHLVYTSAGKIDNVTWTNGSYSVSGERLDGNDNSVFKFSHMGNKIYTLSVPANIIVKQVILTGWNSSESTIGTVTSEGATGIYLPTYYQKTGESTYNIVLNLEGHVAGTDIVMNMALAHQTLVSSIDLKTVTAYTREHPHMNLNTLCFPYEIYEYSGATFYTIQETEVNGSGELVKLVLEEHVGVLKAGTPYFYDPTPGADKLVCYYTGDREDNPKTASDGAFIGAYADNTAIPEGSYVTYNNQLWKTGTGATLGEYRAYVRPVSYSRPAQVGRKRMSIGRYGAPTAVEDVQSDNVQSTKIIRNGQLIIIRDGRTYNMMGQEVR